MENNEIDCRASMHAAAESLVIVYRQRVEVRHAIKLLRKNSSTSTVKGQLCDKNLNPLTYKADFGKTHCKTQPSAITHKCPRSPCATMQGPLPECLLLVPVP